MWSERFAPLRLDLRPSPRLALLVCLCYGGALGWAVFLPLPGWAAVGLVAPVVVAAVATLARHALLLDPRAVRAVIWRGGSEWLLIERGGARRSARLAPDTYVHPWMTVLNFKLGRWRRRTVLVSADRTDREAFRRLRVGLRLYGVRREG